MSVTETGQSQETSTASVETTDHLIGEKTALEVVAEQKEANPAENAPVEIEQSTEEKAPSAEETQVPEKYEFKAPEGKELDASVMGHLGEVAKELGLSQDNAQKIVDKMAPVLEARQQEALATVRNQWEEASKSDKEFGGDKLPESLAMAKKALDTFGSPELNTLLRDSGLGNHPEIIRAFVKAGKAISQDTIATNGGGSQNAKTESTADILYPQN